MFKEIAACGSPVFLNNVSGRITSIVINISLMTLGAKYQEMLNFTVEGSDEEDAALAIKRFMANGMKTL